jgi:hypothetical protein
MMNESIKSIERVDSTQQAVALLADLGAVVVDRCPAAECRACADAYDLAA